MPNIFHPAMNTVSRVSIFGGVFFVALAVWFAWYLVRTPYVTKAHVIREQPVPFSHQHHVSDAGIDCRYCHTSVETSSFAGIPSTGICMNCHSYLFHDAPLLEPVRASFRSSDPSLPISWTRVHDLPDFAYFNHSIHIHKGIGCVDCHGQIDEMPLVWREHSLLMEWCLRCHKHPAKHVRPREFVFDMVPVEELPKAEAFQKYLQREFPEMDPQNPDMFAVRRELMKRYRIQSKLDCSNCHF